MIFDIHFLTVNDTGDDASKTFSELEVDRSNVLKLSILKDPVEDHISTYSIEFIDMNKNLINAVRLNLVDTIVIRIGNDSRNNNGYNFDLLKLYLKPIKIHVPGLNKFDKNNMVIQCVGSFTYALLMDKSFSSKLEEEEENDTQEINFSTDENIKSSKTKSIYSATTASTSTTTATTTTRSNKVISIRNNNPGNQRPNSRFTWLGSVGHEDTSSGLFVTFASPELGIRAMAKGITNKILGKTKNTYTVVYPNGSSKKIKKVTTLRELIYIWTPIADNSVKKTENALINVSRIAGLNPDDPLKTTDVEAIIKGIIKQEGGSAASAYFNKDVIQRGVGLINYSKINKNELSKFGDIGESDLNKMSTYYKSTKNLVSKNRGKIGSTIGNSSTYGTVSYGSIYSAKRGIDFLGSVSAKLFSKYNIVTLNDTLYGGESNYLYEKIMVPNLNAIELIKYIYEWYPPMRLNCPWIIDDAYYTPDTNGELYIGVPAFIPLNLMNIDSLNTAEDGNSSLYNFIVNISGPKPVTNLFNITDQTLYYNDNNLSTLKSTVFNHMNLSGNKETVIKPIDDEFGFTLPIEKGNSSGEIKVANKLLNISEAVNIETNFDAIEFEKRRAILQKHMEGEPLLMRVRLQVNDLSYIQFGKKYYLSDDKTTPMTPYKILQNFTNVNGEFQLQYDILFYAGDIDLVTDT